MLPSKMMQTLTLGLVFAAPLALAEGKTAQGATNYKLNCPSGTKQFGTAEDGIYCRMVDAKAKDGMHTPHGPYVAFYPNGQKRSEGQFVDGFRSGSWTFYSEAGQVTGRTEFQRESYHGKRVLYFANGKPRLVEEYANGKRNGLVQEFSEDGKLVREAQYRDDRQVAEK
jgi:antitoxin component YwqK of YwqJK toxin-antitoxin module